MPRTVKIELDGKAFETPGIVGTEGEKAFDISDLRAKTGYITLDPGYGNTGSCESKITFIDGEKGVLRYRGYPIEELAEKSTFVETAYLLIYGELPTKSQLQTFSSRLNEFSLIHEDMRHFFIAFPSRAHPMGILSTMVASLSVFYPVPDELTSTQEDRVMAGLISQVRTIAAFSYKKFVGEPVVYPSMRLRYVENLLNMLFSSPVKGFVPDPDVVRAIEVILILHADHEQNCSTSSVRMVGSSYGNIYSVISAGISALWGRRHGGANQEVIEMLEAIRDSGDDGMRFIQQAKDKKARLMGFGHRVYKSYDPRAKILKAFCHKLLGKMGKRDPLFDIAMKLEEAALKDDYFITRNLYPNVDFYSGLILKSIGIPTDMFTVFFAIGRTPGWIAHWREMIHEEGFRIARPRQIYQGPTERHYAPIESRQAGPA